MSPPTKAKRPLAGLATGAKLITGSHLPPAMPSGDISRLREQLQKEQVQRDALIAEHVSARTADLRRQLAEASAHSNDRLATLRQELAEAEAKAWDLEQQLAQQVQQARQQGALLPGRTELRFLQPEQFQARPMDSDEIHVRDITEMAAMIAEQGLLQWPVVDAGNRPLSGRRRSLALARLKTEQPARYLALFPQGVPVIALLDVDWDQDPLRADQEMLLMQHTQRRRDKPAVRDAKIRDLASRLRTDPNAKWKGGALADGEYHALKRLTQLFGVSDKAVQRALGATTEPEPAPVWDHARQVLRRHIMSVEQALAALPQQPPDANDWRQASNRVLDWLEGH